MNTKRASLTYVVSESGIYAANPTVNVAVYPLEGFPLTVASSEFKLSAKMLSRVFVVGFEPLDA
jgi:hypothetical protein